MGGATAPFLCEVTPTMTDSTPGTTPDPEKDEDKKVSDLPQQGPEDEDQEVDEWEEESFPASDPPANY
jgi:hypothetical protein